MQLQGPVPVAGDATALTPAQLARRARATPEQVARLVRLGILAPADGQAPYTAADVRRIRLADACEQAGLPLEAIGEAVAAGRLSFAFMNVPAWTVVEATDATYRELCAEQGLPWELVQRLYEATGLGRPQPDDTICSQDRDILAVIGFARTLGIDQSVLIRAARVYGQNLRRISQAEDRLHHDHVETPLLASGMDEPRMGEAVTRISGQLTPLVERMLLALYQRHREQALVAHSVEHIEAALEASGHGRPRLAAPPAMCFLDLAGYTRLTEERGDQAAADLVIALTGLVERVSQDHGGQPVKWLGDGVMFHFADPGRAVLAALEMVERTPSTGLPPAHVGLHAGPVVFQDGDYYGRTVNLAARVAAYAGPGQVLVTDQVVAAARPDGVGYQPIGPVSLKGVGSPVPLHQAVRSAR
jgi:adenylate cyclase